MGTGKETKHTHGLPHLLETIKLQSQPERPCRIGHDVQPFQTIVASGQQALGVANGQTDISDIDRTRFNYLPLHSTFVYDNAACVCVIARIVAFSL